MHKKDIEHSLQELLTHIKTKNTHDWQYTQRSNQKAPETSWRLWMVMAGRGFGKTRMGAEMVRKWALTHPQCRIGLMGYSMEETRKIMLEGHSGLLNISQPQDKISYRISKREIEWPNGSKAYLLSASKPEQLRGMQFHYIWMDEWAKFYNAKEVFFQANITLRLGVDPKMLITTTPRPLPFLEELLSKPDTMLTQGSTWDNKDNLPQSYLHELQSEYKNTTLGEQELEGKFLGPQKKNAWWSWEDIIRARYKGETKL